MQGIVKGGKNDKIPILDANATVDDVALNKTFYSTDPYTKLTGNLSAIKSLQNISISINTGSTSGTVTLSTAVDTVKAIIIPLGVKGSTTTIEMNPKLTFSNSTTVQATIFASATTTITVYALIVEFNPILIKSVQKGTTSVSSSSPVNVTITSVNLIKSLVFYSYSANMGISASVRLSNNYTVTLTENDSSGRISVSWQVIEFL